MTRPFQLGASTSLGRTFVSFVSSVSIPWTVEVIGVRSSPASQFGINKGSYSARNGAPLRVITQDVTICSNNVNINNVCNANLGPEIRRLVDAALVAR